MNTLRNNKIALLLLVVILAVTWTFWSRPIPPASVPVIAKPALSKVQKETITAKVSVYKPAAKKKLHLPKPVQDSPSKHVVDASRVNPDFHSHTITTVLDSETGDVTTYDTKEPLPWLAPGHMGGVGVFYGLKNGKPMGQLYAYHDLLQSKALFSGVRASLDQDGTNYAGGYVEYRW